MLCGTCVVLLGPHWYINHEHVYYVDTIAAKWRCSTTPSEWNRSLTKEMKKEKQFDSFVVQLSFSSQCYTGNQGVLYTACLCSASLHTSCSFHFGMQNCSLFCGHECIWIQGVASVNACVYRRCASQACFKDLD